MRLDGLMPIAKYAGVGLVVVGVAFTVAVVTTSDTVFTRYYRKYTSFLERSLRLLFLPPVAEKIIVGQVAAFALFVAAGALVEPLLYLGALLAPFAPAFYLKQSRLQHVEKLEAQVDSLILGLANALKTVPSPAAALGSLVPILPQPTRQEMERVLKEMRVGSTLEQAILNLSSRLRSPNMDSALSALLIGLQVGGNLPVVLESTAATIREINRLEGVVKTKTSEGRAQLWVLAVFPFAICFAFSQVQEGYFDPLQHTFMGYLVTAVAVMFWVASLVAASRILKVDI